MARLKKQKVEQTKSGLFMKIDADAGIFVYSPYSGLVFACREGDKAKLSRWFNKKTDKAPSPIYEKALGLGWAVSLKNTEYPVQHLLPDSNDDWPIIAPKEPILINWLLTGNCPLDCTYCDASDLMHGKCKEPNKADIRRIAEIILSYNPLIVVLTGGDPLFSPYLAEVIRILHKRTGIIVDTSGYTFKSTHLELFKKYNIFVRVSLDSEIPRINNDLRQVRNDSRNLQKGISPSDAAINAICKCIDAGVKVAVQSVATTKNRHDFEALGDKLFKLGVSGWRILMVAPSEGNKKIYKKLSGSDKSQERFYKHIWGKVQSRYERQMYQKMAVQVTHNRIPNAVILVGPDGIFQTEYNGKVVLDSEYPKRPRLSMMFKKVSSHAHAARYLNLRPRTMWL